jgi:hypothetical protein
MLGTVEAVSLEKQVGLIVDEDGGSAIFRPSELHGLTFNEQLVGASVECLILDREPWCIAFAIHAAGTQL